MTAPVDMEPTCPSDETLAAFVEGRLDDARRAAVVAHLATCAECRDIVVATSEFQRSEEEGGHLVTGRFGRGAWWLAAAAAAAAVIVFLFLQPFRRAGIEELVKASDTLETRTVDGRLAGGFAYKPRPRVTRSGDGEALDPAFPLLRAADKVLNSEPTDHDRGVALLLLERRDEAIKALESAHARANADAGVAVDLATALIARGTQPDLVRALELSDGAWRSAKMPEAAWNRALALEYLRREPEAIEAWNEYLRVDPDSKWSAEAERNLGRLRP
jgi:tetratricopeptide (TPR) repeat protein